MADRRHDIPADAIGFISNIKKRLGMKDESAYHAQEDERKKKEQELERERRKTALERGFK